MSISPDLLGFVASFIVLVSLLMSSWWHLRIINLVGALAFAAYGVLIGAAPVAVMNFLIVSIDVFYLWRMVRERRNIHRAALPPSGSSRYKEIPSWRGYSHDFLLR